MLTITSIRQKLARSSKKTYQRAKPIASFSLTVMMTLSMLMTSLGLQYASVAAAPAANIVGQGFTVSPADLAYILQQIKIAERHSNAFLTNTPPNPNPLADPFYCSSMLGTAADQIASPLLSLGLRTVTGDCNNLQPGQSKYGAADQTFPRLTTPVFKTAEDSTVPGIGPVGPPGITSYAQTSGSVVDSEPRMISNLIVDQTSTNPAAIAAAGFPVRSQGADPVVPCDKVNGVDVQPLQPLGCVPQFETLFIENITTDVGLSPPFNSLFTIFGQFFDHGLDKITNGGSGTVFVPLSADDPLVAGDDHIFGTPDDLPAGLRFMTLTRGTNVMGADGFRNSPNTDSPFVDQSQTYTSHASHQIFLREYVNNILGKPVSTGKFLSSPDGDGMANWAQIKLQAATFLGIQLVDTDVNNIPLIAADPYGKFVPGLNGLPQLVTNAGLVEGNLLNPVRVDCPVVGPGCASVYTGGRINTAFLNDIAHSAGPGSATSPKTPDANNTAGGSLDPVAPGEYDNELLDLHFICGDGRCNENIALTAVHQMFHSEHDRLVDYIENVLFTDTSGITLLADWQTPNGAPNGANVWNGERVFQAARFVTEMEYQHLVFEEFARKVQPAINPFQPFAFNQTDLNPAITAEFAHAVYRFGHSMLTETIARTNANGSTNDIPLFDGFLNPAEYYNGGTAGHLTSKEAATAIIMGMSDQSGNEIDEFVTDVLRNHLVGLPLDLPAINMTRARSEGIPPLNSVRRQIFAATNDGQLKPYDNWIEFQQFLKHPESLVNFIAAYGTHPNITGLDPDGAGLILAGSVQARRAAADQIVNGTTLPGPDGILFDNPLTFIDESLDDTPGVPGVPAINAVQSLVWTGPAVDFTLTGDLGTTSLILTTDLIATIDAALDAVVTGGVTVSGGPTAADGFVVTFDVGGPVADLIASDLALTVATTTTGVAAIPAIPAGCGPDGFCGDNPLTFINEALDNIFPPLDAADFMFGTGTWATLPGLVTSTGLDAIDLWVGGLAENTNLFGGLLGSTFNYVFEKQLTDLQNGDRLYYLARTPGMNLRAQLEGNSFAELVMRNTNAHTLKADPFATADCKFEIGLLTFPAPGGSFITGAGSVADTAGTACNENRLLLNNNGQIKYRATNSVDPAGINGQAVYNGTSFIDRIFGGNDNDTFWGGLSNDIIEGGGGDDVVLGGEGNDIITDFGGADVPKGGPGNDAIDSGIGDDIVMGGDGKDFTNAGGNINETFGGAGDDFAIAGAGEDAIFGDSGDDWEEGGDQPDLLIGDSSTLFFNDNNLPGHDVLIGQSGDDDYDMEGGDDIGVAGPGVEKNAGAAGYDWLIGLNDPQAQDMDLSLPLIGIALPANGIRDRFNEVEALSGWNLNDILRGDSIIPSQVGGGGFIGCDALDEDGVARIAGLEALVTPAIRIIDPAAAIAATSTNYCGLVGPIWGEGNILLGGSGNDLLEGRGGDDILDGDRYLNVRLSVRDPNNTALEIGSTDLMEHAALSGNFGAGTAGKTLQQAVFAGLVDPGNIVIVRELLVNPGAELDTDTAAFSGSLADYDITQNLDGSVTVSDAAGAAIDGTDTLWNMEQLAFCLTPGLARGTCDVFDAPILISSLFVVNTPASGVVTFSPAGTPTEGILLTADGAGIIDPNGVGVLTFTWQSEITPFNWSDVGTGLTFTPLNNAVGFPLRVVASFFDGLNAFESVTSAATAPVINVNDAPTGTPILGTPQLNVALTADTSTIADADGLVGVTFSFVWLANGFVIPGETGVSFTPTAAQGGQTLQVRVSFTDNHGTAESLTSASTAAVPAPVAQVTPGSLAFGSIPVGINSATQTITVTNTGNATLTVSGASISPLGQFSIVGSDCASVVPAGSCTIDVRFTPTTTGAKAATLGILHDGLNGSPSNVSLSGTGIASAPVANVSPVSLNFGSVANGTLSAVQNITVGNTGNANLVVSSVTLGGTNSNQFAIASNNCATVAPAGSCTIGIRFAPTTTGAKSATLSIAHNAAGTPSVVTLTGSGVGPTITVPANTTFGTRTVGTSRTQTITVTNTGPGALVITSVIGSAPFTVTLGTCGVPIAAGRTCRLSVTFTPTAVGAVSRQLQIISNAGNGTPVIVNVSGAGK